MGLGLIVLGFDVLAQITASHLPEDRNGMKFFTKMGGLTNVDIEILADAAAACAKEWYDVGIIPPSSGNGAVFCSSRVRFKCSQHCFFCSWCSNV